MAEGATRGPNVRDIESLRIERPSLAPARSRRFMQFLAGILAIIATAGTVAFLYPRTIGRPPEVQIAIVSIKAPGRNGVLLTGSGYVVTQHKYIVIGTKILGQIVEEPIEEGQHVHMGDLLARIDDRDYQAQLRQAVADRDLAVADVKLKRAQAIRIRELYQNQIVSRDQFDVAENAWAVAEADEERANAAIDYARFNVNQCIIQSPIDGIVLQKYRELGDTINYGGEIQAGGGSTDIVQLADTTDMRTEVDVNESDIAKVIMGQPAEVTPDAYPNRSFAAFVAKIYPEADRQKGTVKIEVKIRQPDLTIIKPEMSAKVSFLDNGGKALGKPLIVVPKQAVIHVGNESAVWVVRDGAAHRVQILTGVELEDGLEVRHGLIGGEMVIIAPPATLKDDSAVRITTS